jgi:hypothetical protein
MEDPFVNSGRRKSSHRGGSSNRPTEQRVVRAIHFKPPQPMSGSDFDLICSTFKIQRQHQNELRNFFADVVTVFRAAIADESSLPSRENDRVDIARAINLLREAQMLLKKKKGPAGLRAFELTGQQIAPALAGSWLQSHFPNEFKAPTEVNPPADYDPLRLRDADWLSERENRSLDFRVDFVMRHGGATITKLLSDEIMALESGHRLIIRLPPGRHPLKHRIYLLSALAELWRRIGRPPTTGKNSEFGSFCEAVFETIGWPTDGVNSALWDAINLSRTLYPKAS